MKTPLWVPSLERKQRAAITAFMTSINQRHGLTLGTYPQLHRWSVENIPDFWAAMWSFAEIKASHPYDDIVEDLGVFPGTRWFPGARLNFAENLLRYGDDRPALIFQGETQRSARLTYRELHGAVSRLAEALRRMGIKPGDRIAGYMPNMIETVVAMLAATSLGAVWSSCATDVGPQAALDRLGQIQPRVLFSVDAYFYRGKVFDCIENVRAVAQGIPSLDRTVIVPYVTERPGIDAIPKGALWDDFLAKQPSTLSFEQLAFDHPVYIMFSSGTTGKPKCMVQGAGGILINHMKELLLHIDLRRDDTMCYITTCSWMMWNWMLTSLAVGATVVLYDGNPTYPKAGSMWQLVQDQRVSVFGLSASYVNFLRAQGIKPGEQYDLSALREVCQTGSALSPEGFEYVHRAIRNDMHFNSIAGGTDINGCFFAGNPISPVFAGELQAPALAMKVKAYDDGGQAVIDRQGELVCEAPAPSMPLYFWDDPTGAKYRGAYFDVYPHIWRHGDYIVIHGDTGGVTFYGRSDAVLKPSGVRIGPAEIYNQMEKLEEIADSLAIGQQWQGDQRIILFVKLAAGCALTDDLRDRIKGTLRENASPRHVPALIVAVPDIPYTLNMKKVESAVTNIVNGRPVTNREALVNPDALDYYERILPELGQ